MPNSHEPPPSLKTLVDAIAALETQYGADSVTGIDRVRQKATLNFLASLKELVQAFCLQGCDDEDECSYVPYTLRGK
jgi:hypothetical protein